MPWLLLDNWDGSDSSGVRSYEKTFETGGTNSASLILSQPLPSKAKSDVKENNALEAKMSDTATKGIKRSKNVIEQNKDLLSTSREDESNVPGQFCCESNNIPEVQLFCDDEFDRFVAEQYFSQ